MEKEMTNYIEEIKTIKALILQSRYQAARLANRELLKLYFLIGGFISAKSRSEKWGTAAIDTISRRLQEELPGLRGFSATNIKYMRIFYETWSNVFATATELRECLPRLSETLHRHLASDESFGLKVNDEIRHSTSDELSEQDGIAFSSIGFTHHRTIFSASSSPEERWYYIRKCAQNFWSVETLKAHIRAEDFKRLGSEVNNFALTIPDERQVARAVRAFKDEYLLDFINIEESSLEEDVDERVLENAIVSDIRKFIMSFGEDFCFIGNQYRMIVGEEEFFVDLLFFHRGLRCLVAVELKGGKFRPAYIGQLNFYLSALDRYVKRPYENPSIGLLLCREANKAVVELAVPDANNPIGVAIYRTNRDIPEEYKALRPLMNGVKKILANKKE